MLHQRASGSGNTEKGNMLGGGAKERAQVGVGQQQQQQQQQLPPRPRDYSAAEVEEKVDMQAVVAKLNRHLLPLVFAGALASAVDRGNVSYAAKHLNKDLGFSDKAYGFGAGVFFWGYSLSIIPSSLAAVRYGPAKWVAAACVVWGTIAASFVALHGEGQFYVMRFMLGITEAGAATLVFLLSLFYSPRDMNLAYAWTHMATPASQVAGGLLAAAILSMDGFLGLAGWRWLFFLEGLPTVVLGLVFMTYLPNSVSEATFLSKAEREAYQEYLHAQVPKGGDSSSNNSGGEDGKAGSTGGGGGSHRGGVVHSASRVLLDWRVWWLGGILFLLNAAVSGCHFWLPLLTDSIMNGSVTGGSRHSGAGWWNTHGAAVLTTIPYGLSAFSSYAVASSARQRGENRWHIAAPVLVGAASFVALPYAFNHYGPYAAFVVMLVAICCTFSVHSPLMCWPTSMLQGPAASTGLAVMKMLGGMGSFCGPFAIGWLKQSTGSYEAPMRFMACSLVMAATLSLAMNQDLRGVRIYSGPNLSSLARGTSFQSLAGLQAAAGKLAAGKIYKRASSGEEDDL